MLVSLIMNNTYICDSETEFSLIANMTSRRFTSNTVSVGKVRVVKSAVVLEPNNAGKTNLIKCISAIKQLILDKTPFQIETNMFTDNPVCSLEVTFSDKNKIYGLAVQYNVHENNFVLESYFYVEGKGSKEKKTTLLSREYNSDLTVNDKFFLKDADDLISAAKFASHNHMLLNVINTEELPRFNMLKSIYREFAEKIDIVDMNQPIINKTIEMMKSSKENQRRISNFVKKC